MSLFPILGKNLLQFHLIIIRECPQNNITHILRYFNNFSLIYLDPFHLIPPYLFPNTPKIKDKRILSFFIILSCINSLSRSNLPDVFCKKGVLRNFAKFTGKHQCQSLFFNKVASLRPATLLKRDSDTCVFL